MVLVIFVLSLSFNEEYYLPKPTCIVFVRLNNNK